MAVYVTVCYKFRNTMTHYKLVHCCSYRPLWKYGSQLFYDNISQFPCLKHLEVIHSANRPYPRLIQYYDIDFQSICDSSRSLEGLLLSESGDILCVNDDRAPTMSSLHHYPPYKTLKRLRLNVGKLSTNTLKYIME